jgi:methanethiol S-methyltransferase
MIDSVLIIYIVLFTAYFIIHSLTASLGFKNWCFSLWPNLKLTYRLWFNILSSILLVPLIILLVIYPGEILWQWTGWQAVFVNILAVSAAIGFYFSLSDYNMTEFWGINIFSGQISKNLPKEQFYIGRFHLYVRHPWYFFLLIILWTRDMTTYQFLTAVLISLYLIIGSYLEEQKMISYFGEVYRMYQQKVAGLIPLPWKFLTRKEADRLLEK